MLVLHIVFIGVGATLITDIWTMARARVFGVASLDYGLVGRWFGHMLEGRFVHERITASPRFEERSFLAGAFITPSACCLRLVWLLLAGLSGWHRRSSCQRLPSDC